MRITGCVVATLVAVGIAAAADDQPKVLTFGKTDLGKVPAGWKADQTGKGAGGGWKVVEDPTAPSKAGYALAQTAESTGPVFNLCVFDGVTAKNVEVSVAFKANAGKKDQGGGVVWRYQDANNYYVARVNPLEDNVRVYKVVGGKRSAEFQTAEVKIPAGEWHTLTVKMAGDRIECSVDGKKYLEASDDAFTKPGKVGLWTKADARTSFDNVQITNLGQ